MEIKVRKGRGSHPVIVCKLRQNVPLKSFRTGPRGVKVWHNVISCSFSLFLVYTELYNIHCGSNRTEQFLCTSDDENPLKVNMAKHIRSLKGKDSPIQRQCALNIDMYCLGSEKALLLTGTQERCCSANQMLWQP